MICKSTFKCCISFLLIRKKVFQNAQTFANTQLRTEEPHLYQFLDTTCLHYSETVAMFLIHKLWNRIQFPIQNNFISVNFFLSNLKTFEDTKRFIVTPLADVPCI